MERLSSLGGSIDDDDDYARFGMAMSPKAAELIGLTVPSGDDDASGVLTGGEGSQDELGLGAGGLTPPGRPGGGMRASDSTVRKRNHPFAVARPPAGAAPILPCTVT